MKTHIFFRTLLILFTLVGFSSANAAYMTTCDSEEKLASSGEIFFPKVTDGAQTYAEAVNIEFWVRGCDKVGKNRDYELIASLTPVVAGKSEVGIYSMDISQNNRLFAFHSGIASFDNNLKTKTNERIDSSDEYQTLFINYSQPFTVKITCYMLVSAPDCSSFEKTFTLDPKNGSSVSQNTTVSSVTGAWYDPAYNGMGFNIIDTPNGYVMYFYGYKSSGNGDTLWLASGNGPTTITKGERFDLPLYSGYTGNGANFMTKPTDGPGIQQWGTAQVTFNSCIEGVITLAGNDGTLTHNIQRLVGVQGLNCTD